MDQAWKNINGFILSFTSSFDQLKISLDAKIKKKKKNEKVIFETCQFP